MPVRRCFIGKICATVVALVSLTRVAAATVLVTTTVIFYQRHSFHFPSQSFLYFNLSYNLIV